MERCSSASLVIQGPPVTPAQQCSGLSSQCQHPAKAPSESSWCTDKFLYHFSLSTLCGSSGCPGSPSLYLDKHRACDILQLISSNSLCCQLSVQGSQQKTERCSGNVVGILSSSSTLCVCLPLPLFLVDGTFLLSNCLS